MIAVAASSASSQPRGANFCLAHAPEAAARSGLAQDIIVRVMMAESGGDDHAISPKGAMGCMQIMPATWAMLTARYGLGSDPYDARANMIGGSLYLAGLARRHGFPGAYAAYNAGEKRWLRYRDSGVPLPVETVAYMARLGADAPGVPAPPSQPRWQEAALFVAHNEDRASPDSSTPSRPPATVQDRESGAPAEPTVRTLFPLSRRTAPVAE
ncbi:lytic transglycosylase domain-containing protein [Sphingomonas paucimobilis]|nr:lytic transglycosylase domain-containing protein [Sphingomonas paucimobilis]